VIGLTQAGGVSDAVLPWALATAGFYAWRLLSVRDLGLWAIFLATSGLALTWGLAVAGAEPVQLHAFVLVFSLPAALLMGLASALEARFGAAYAGLPGGLAQVAPRLAGALVFILLAAVATPLFPGFFAVIGLLAGIDDAARIAVLVIVLVWSWAASRALQGFVFGPPPAARVADLSPANSGALVLVLALFVLVGGWFFGGAL
jgi:NADH:ubiquinone oxidoreductase subunit 4 (subunit M)